MTFDRLEKLVPAENILVVTHARYKSSRHAPSRDACREHLVRALHAQHRSVHRIRQRRHRHARPAGLGGRGAFGPLDFGRIRIPRGVPYGVGHHAQHHELGDVGHPAHPSDTGYGYIQYEEAHDEARSEVRPVKTFTEKPDLATAETFLASGEFCWNSGIFVWSLSNIQAAFEAHLPDMLAEFADADLTNPTEINAVYGNCENISIDYGIMEKASQVQVVLV